MGSGLLLNGHLILYVHRINVNEFAAANFGRIVMRGCYIRLRGTALLLYRELMHRIIQSL